MVVLFGGGTLLFLAVTSGPRARPVRPPTVDPERIRAVLRADMEHGPGPGRVIMC